MANCVWPVAKDTPATDQGTHDRRVFEEVTHRFAGPLPGGNDDLNAMECVPLSASASTSRIAPDIQRVN